MSSKTSEEIGDAESKGSESKGSDPDGLDLEDPINWSWRKKHVYLAIVCLLAFLPDFGSGLSVPLVLPQTTLGVSFVHIVCLLMLRNLTQVMERVTKHHPAQP